MSWEQSMFSSRVIWRDTQPAADPSQGWEEPSREPRKGCCPRSGGIMADLWPCLRASSLVILLCYQSNEAKIALQTTDCNYTFTSQSLEGGRRLWLGMRRSQKVTRQTAFWYFSLKKQGCNVCSLKKRRKPHWRGTVVFFGIPGRCYFHGYVTI